MEYLLRTYRKLNKKSRKGFTLVELLVVIAILAVLASVSVVGYLGFTTKAKHTTAMTELSQARQVIKAELIDNTAHTYYLTSGESTWTSSSTKGDDSKTFTFTYSSEGTLNYTFDTVESSLTWDVAFKTIFNDLNSLSGTFTVYVSSGSISSISYEKNGGKAKWTISGDKLENGNDVTLDTTGDVTKYPTD